MHNNRLIIAAAGSGKTTKIVDEALQLDESAKILITTYTRENRDEIIRKFYKKYKSGCVPANIDVITWFSFLLQHGVRPYQTALVPNLKGVRIGFELVNQKSATIKTKAGKTYSIGQNKPMQYYFNKAQAIYSDKISKFVIKTDQVSQGAIFNRLSRIYSHIFIDEGQDLAGWDLEIVKKISSTIKNLCVVCDPRQTVIFNS